MKSLTIRCLLLCRVVLLCVIIMQISGCAKRHVSELQHASRDETKIEAPTERRTILRSRKELEWLVKGSEYVVLAHRCLDEKCIADAIANGVDIDSIMTPFREISNVSICNMTPFVVLDKIYAVSGTSVNTGSVVFACISQKSTAAIDNTSIMMLFVKEIDEAVIRSLIVSNAEMKIDDSLVDWYNRNRALSSDLVMITESYRNIDGRYFNTVDNKEIDLSVLEDIFDLQRVR